MHHKQDHEQLARLALDVTIMANYLALLFAVRIQWLCLQLTCRLLTHKCRDCQSKASLSRYTTFPFSDSQQDEIITSNEGQLL